MALTPAMPFVQIREFGDDGKFLPNGKIYFYAKGTTTPKATYQDIAGTIPNTNPVLLDAGASAKVFASGAYSYKITRTDAGLETVVTTGDFTTDASSAGAGTLGIYQNYAALAASAGTDAFALVIDGFNAGDRQGGLFVLNNAATAAVTDGITVVDGSFKYSRDFSGAIDPRWCGVVYGSTAQALNVNRANKASADYGFPVEYSGAVQVESTITVPNKAAVILSAGCVLSGATVLEWQFTAGGQLVSAQWGVFGPNIRPRFYYSASTDYVQVRLSWFNGATTDESLAAFLAAPNSNTTELVVDRDLAGVQSTDFNPSCPVFFENGTIYYTAATRNVSISKWTTPPLRQIFSFQSAVLTGTISLPEPARPEWFGGVGNGSADDTVPFNACAKNGAVRLRGTYKIGASLTYAGSLILIGETPLTFDGIALAGGGYVVMQGNTLTVASCTLQDAAVVGNAGQIVIASSSSIFLYRSNISGTGATDATCLQFVVRDGWIRSKANITASSYFSASDTIYTAVDVNAVISDSPKVKTRNGYFEDIVSAQYLVTDADGKVGVSTTATPTVNTLTANLGVLSLGYSQAKYFVTGLESISSSGGTLSGTKGHILVDNRTASVTITIPNTYNVTDYLIMGMDGSHTIVVNCSGSTTFGTSGGTTWTINTTPNSVTWGRIVLDGGNKWINMGAGI